MLEFFSRLIKGNPCWRRLLACENSVDAVSGGVSFLAHGQQKVGIGRIIDVYHVIVVVALVEQNIDKAWILVREAIVVLSPHVARKQYIDGRDGLAPRDMADRCLKPLCVLVDHGVHNVHERLVAGPNTITTGQHVALKQAFALMLGKLLDDVAYGRNVLVIFKVIVKAAKPLLVRYLERGLQAVGCRLVRTKNAEV